MAETSDMATWGANEHRIWADGYERGRQEGYEDGFEDGNTDLNHGDKCKLCAVNE